MAVYQWKGAGYGLPIVGGGAVRVQRRIDVPALIAAGADAGLALVAAPNVGVALESTGFAANDILEAFWVPKGTIVLGVGAYVITGEGATCTVNFGCTSATETHDLGGNIDGWEAAGSIQTAGVLIGTADADEFGTDNYPLGIIYVTDGSIDVEFNHATDAAIFQLWADVKWLDIA